MFFQTILVSLIAILMGLALSLAGYRFFVILLPIWGFFAGLSMDSQCDRWLRGYRLLEHGSELGAWATGGAALCGARPSLLLRGDHYFGGHGRLPIRCRHHDLGRVSAWLHHDVSRAGARDHLRVWRMVSQGPQTDDHRATSLAGAASLLAGVFLAFGTIPLADLQWGAVMRQAWRWARVYLALLAAAAQWMMTSTSYTLDAYSPEPALT